MYHNGDYVKMKALLYKCNWSSHVDDNVDDMRTFFIDTMQNAVNECVPVSKPGKSVKRKEWLTSDALRAISEMNKAWK